MIVSLYLTEQKKNYYLIDLSLQKSLLSSNLILKKKNKKKHFSNSKNILNIIEESNDLENNIFCWARFVAWIPIISYNLIVSFTLILPMFKGESDFLFARSGKRARTGTILMMKRYPEAVAGKHRTILVNMATIHELVKAWGQDAQQ